MSADAPLSYFYNRAANPLRRCAPAPPKGELFSGCRSAAIKLSLRESWQNRKALTERVLYNSLLQIFFDLLPQVQETAALIRIINRRLLVFFTGSTNYFFSD